MKKKSLLIILTLSVIGLILAIPFDLSISQFLFNQNNLLGRFGEAVGEVPGILVGVFGCAALILTYKKNSKFSKISSFIFGSLFLVLLSFMAASLPTHYIESPSWVTYLFTLIYLVGAIYLVKKTPETSYPTLRKYAWVAVLTLLTETIVVNLIKFGWSRVRYRDLVESTSAFSAWFIPNGFTGNTDHMSFPSGHVANAAVILFITLLPNVYLNLQKYRKLLVIFSFIWIALIMVSRIIMGAHFLSDTIVGMWVTILSILLYQNVFKIEKE